MSTTTDAPNPVKKHKRDVRWKIIAPIVAASLGLVALAIVLIVAVATDAMVFEQVSVISGLLAIPFVLLPLVVLCVVPYLLVGALAIGAGQANARARSPIRKARRLTERVAVRTHRTLPRLARPLISFNARFARWEHTLLGWQRSALEPGKDNPHE